MKYYCDIKLFIQLEKYLKMFWLLFKKQLFEKINLKNIYENFLVNCTIETKSRSSTILPLFKGFIINVYNGKEFIKVFIDKPKFFLKLGEFSITKKICRHNKKKKKKK